MSEVTDVIDVQLDAYNARELERFVDSYSPAAVITDSAGTVLAEGHEGIRAMYGGLFDASPDLSGRILNRIEVGSYVADHEQIEGFVLPGSPTSVTAIAVYQVTDGKIARVALYF